MIRRAYEPRSPSVCKTKGPSAYFVALVDVLNPFSYESMSLSPFAENPT